MKRVIKLFWSYNIVKIEKWLGKMAKRGYILKDVNTTTKVFTFEKDESRDLTYRICYENKGIKDITNSLKYEGWNTVVSNNRWIFICNENKEENIRLSPSRENLLKRNKKIKTGMWIFVWVYGGMFLPIWIIVGLFMGLGGIGAIPVEYDDTTVVETSQPYLAPYIIQNMLFVALIFAVYTIVKLNKLDKQLRSESNTYEVEYDNDICVENKVKIKKTKAGWFYAPDKTEKWLEEMESKGFNLYKLNKVGSTFHFIKGEPRKIKYIIDYQGNANETYFEIHKQDGWKLNFKSWGNIFQFCIWSKEYEEIEPEIYTDNNDLLKHAKKVLIMHTIALAPVLLIYPYIIICDIGSLIRGNGDLFGIFISTLLLVEFGVFYKNILGYYLRTKKKIAQS